MTLMPGTRLGPYEVIAAIGAGGMGEVYRARDTKLGREVALKILPELPAADPDRLMRFEREAQMLAALNHPHIAQIYGLEDGPPEGSPHVLILELVEGPTLADLLEGAGRSALGARQSRGLPLEQALGIARQIADALEAAHNHGIIHRDLKPANVKVRPDGTVKVLDFGLAKALDPLTPALSPTGGEGVSSSPTITSPVMMTRQGIILGTAAYMAPEQARGKPVDKRADIWAFGCVLYEMLAGRPAFAGESVTEILARVIEREPEWTAVPAATPPAVRRLLRRCLQKDPRRRLADIADARLELDAGAEPEDLQPARGRPVRPPWRHPAIAVAAAATIVALVAILGWLRLAGQQEGARPQAVYVVASLSVTIPNLMALVDRFAVAPDGTAVVFTGDGGGLVLRRLDDLEARPIPGVPPDAFLPVYSPDGQWVAFFSGQAVMKIPAAGGIPVQLTPATPESVVSLAWSADDRLRFPSINGNAIHSVASSGGAVETISFGADVQVRRAEWLPGGRLLVSVTTEAEDRIAVREPDGSLRTLVAGRDGRLTPTGHLLYARDEGAVWSLMAVPLETASATLMGESRLLARNVPVNYATPAAVTTQGDLYYLRGEPRADRRVVIVDRSGAEREVLVPAHPWIGVTISPDGQQLALTRWEGARRTIWTLVLATQALTQVTFDGDTFGPLWMPDGIRLLFTHFPSRAALATTTMWSVAVDGLGRMEPIFEHPDAYPGGVSADGLIVYYHAWEAQTGADIFSVELAPAGPRRRAVLSTRAFEGNPLPSPGGDWLAYATDASGRREARLARLADLATAVQVSTSGGTPMRWSPDGRRLFYRDGDGISVVAVGPDGPILGSRQRAFVLPHDVRGGGDVMPDGSHAVLVRGGPIHSDLVLIQGALSPPQ